MIIDGTLLVGTAGTAAEVGHVPCEPGRSDVWPGPPRLPGGDRLRHRHRPVRRGSPRRGERSRLRGVAPLTASVIAEAARAGDAARPARLRRRGARALGRSFGALVNILGPDAIALGGGVGSNVDLLEAPIRAAMAEIAFETPLRRCRLGQAELGSDAGLVGAVAWAVRSFAHDASAEAAGRFSPALRGRPGASPPARRTGGVPDPGLATAVAAGARARPPRRITDSSHGHAIEAQILPARLELFASNGVNRRCNPSRSRRR